MAYTRKTADEWRVMVNYGDGFEEVHTATSRTEAKQIAADYRANSPQYPVKWTGPHRVKLEA